VGKRGREKEERKREVKGEQGGKKRKERERGRKKVETPHNCIQSRVPKT